jgi:hypothetical protein
VKPGDFDRILHEELDALLRQAEPSPAFRARVLQHIDAEPESFARAKWFAVIPPAAAITLLVLGALAWLRVPADEGPVLPERPAAAPVATAPRPTTVPGRSTNTSDRRSARTEAVTPSSASEVLISPDDAAAFDAFIASIEGGRLWADMFEPSDNSVPAAIEPLHVEPLATIPPLKEAEL